MSFNHAAWCDVGPRCRRGLGGVSRRQATPSRQRPQAVSEIVIHICDSGLLVAYLNRNDPYHAWAVALMQRVAPPLLTCEPVLTEAVYFLRPTRRRRDDRTASTMSRADRGPEGFQSVSTHRSARDRFRRSVIAAPPGGSRAAGFERRSHGGSPILKRVNCNDPVDPSRMSWPMIVSGAVSVPPNCAVSGCRFGKTCGSKL